jgi:acyl dehydratase
MTTDDGVYASDLLIDHPYPIGSYTVSLDDIIGFATQWDPQSFHIDQESAKAGFYGEVIASGLQTLCVYQRLAVLNLYYDWKIIAGRAMTDVRFHKPVRPGTTLAGTVTITGVEPRRGERCLVHKFGQLVDDTGDPIFSVRVEAYMQDRDGAPAG